MWIACDGRLVTTLTQSDFTVRDEGKPQPIAVFDNSPLSFRKRYVSQGEVIDRARKDDVMVYAVGMRSRPARAPMQPGTGPGGLQAMLTADLPEPGLARVAQETGGDTPRFASAKISARPSLASRTNYTVNT